jgi:arginyl-tRNA--protein-N-Asp/Glu arginylyltransferase
VRSARSAWATEEQYALFRRYLDARHADGGMADMDVFEFAAMIEETPVKTRVVEYRDRDRDDALTAVCLTDILDDGLSLVYSFFDPDLTAIRWAPT